MISRIQCAFWPYVELMRLDKPRGIVLLLWPTLWALWIAAQGHPDMGLVIVFVFGGMVMRSAGCVLNDFADRGYDGLVARTCARPFPTGRVTIFGALLLFFCLCGLAASLLIFLNWQTRVLSLIALLLAIIYPFSKRIFVCPQLILGFAFAWAIPMAFSALGVTLDGVCWSLYILTVFWVIGYDAMYALADVEDDVYLPVGSIALWLGKYTQVCILLINSLVWLGLVCLGLWLKFSLVYYAVLIGVLGLIIYQGWMIIYTAKYLQAFLFSQWIGGAVFLGVFLQYYVN